MCSLWLQKPFKEELEWLQQQDIITSLGMDETVEFCNSFVKWEIRLWLDPARLNQALIRLLHIGPTLNDILPKLNNAWHLSLIDVSSGYHNLKLDEKLSYLTTFACQFGWYRYQRLPFGAAPAGNIFQRKMDEIFKDLPNVFGIADDILVLGYDVDGKDHDHTLWRVLADMQTGKSKTKQWQMSFQMHISPTFLVKSYPGMVLNQTQESWKH